MALMDEFKEERASIKNGTFKQKFSYFWCYYKWHVICSVLAVVIVVSYIHAVVTRKDIAFYEKRIQEEKEKRELLLERACLQSVRNLANLSL